VAERERQPHLPDARCRHGAGAGAVDRRTAHRPAGAAGHRLLLRPHLDAAGAAQALLPWGRDLFHAGAVRDAHLAAVVDRRMQGFFIGVGSVVASLLPWLLAKWGVPNTAAPGEVPDTVRYAFYAGGTVLLLAILWTILRTREYPPEVLRSFDDAEPEGSIATD